MHLASRDGKNITCLNNIILAPHCGIEDIDRTDLIIISSEDLTHLDQSNDRIKQWLLDQHEKGANIGSVCTGAFMLAETGLLKGKRATTHWGFADLFRKKYPDVLLRPECLITDEGDLFCCGGAHSYFDLCLCLVEKYCDYEAAKRMIENSGMNIAEISYAVGYEDVSFFRSLFKRHERTAPNEYKQRFAGPPVAAG